MKDQILQVKRNLNNSNLNNKYLFIDEKIKFIYKNSSLNQVVGMNNFLRNKIVEIINEHGDGNKRFVLLKVDKDIVGWTQVTNDTLIRLYRLPKVNGKISLDNNTEYDFNNVNYENDILQLRDRIIKAHYMFYYGETKYLIVSKVDRKCNIPLKINMFKKLVFPQEELKIQIPKNTLLYNSSNFNSKISEIKNSGTYNVVSYINESAEARIEVSKERYWVKAPEMLPIHQEFSHDLETLEVIDFITYLTESNKHHIDRVKILNNKLNRIRKNITYNHENEEIYLKNQLGDLYVD